MLITTFRIVTVRIRFSVWLVSAHAHEFILLSVVIVTLPQLRGTVNAGLENAGLEGGDVALNYLLIDPGTSR